MIENVRVERNNVQVPLSPRPRCLFCLPFPLHYPGIAFQIQAVNIIRHRKMSHAICRLARIGTQSLRARLVYGIIYHSLQTLVAAKFCL